MKLKKWVQGILIIVSLIAGMMMTYNVEITMIPFIIGSITFCLSISVLYEYGTVFDEIKAKLEEFMSR